MTEVNINDIVSSVRAVDGESLLSPEVLEKIVSAVLDAVQEREEHQIRVRRERQLESESDLERERELG
jgi:hypothetical protein